MDQLLQIFSLLKGVQFDILTHVYQKKSFPTTTKNSFYLNICRGLFEKDKLLYAFLKASSISKRAGDISPEEWNIYLRGSTTDFSSFKNPYDYIN